MKLHSFIPVAILLIVAFTSGTVVAQASSEAISNGGFESNGLSGWSALGNAVAVHYISHSGKYSLQLGAKSGPGQASQEFTLPAGTSGQLSFWYLGIPGDYGTTALLTTLLGADGTIIQQWVGKIDFKWHEVTFNIGSEYSNQRLTLRFYGQPDLIHDSYQICRDDTNRCLFKVFVYPVYVFVDDVSVTCSS